MRWISARGICRPTRRGCWSSWTPTCGCETGLCLIWPAPPPWFPSVAVASRLPAGRRAAAAQRTRWEHGSLLALLHYGPRLVFHSIRQRRLDLLALALDLSVPPLSLLVTLLVAMAI